MKKSELFELLDKELTSGDVKLLNDYVFDKEKNGEWDQSNKGKSWTDDELKVVLGKMAEFNSVEKLNIEAAEIESTDVMSGDRKRVQKYNGKYKYDQGLQDAGTDGIL